MNIVNLIHMQQKEIAVAKARVQQKPQEVANIVMWRGGNHTVVRYIDMKTAIKQFDALVKAADSGVEKFVLTGASSTAVISHPRLLDSIHLLDVEAGNQLMADTQRRMNAMMQLP